MRSKKLEVIERRQIVRRPRAPLQKCATAQTRIPQLLRVTALFSSARDSARAQIAQIVSRVNDPPDLLLAGRLVGAGERVRMSQQRHSVASSVQHLASDVEQRRLRAASASYEVPARPEREGVNAPRRPSSFPKDVPCTSALGHQHQPKERTANRLPERDLYYGQFRPCFASAADDRTDQHMDGKRKCVRAKASGSSHNGLHRVSRRVSLQPGSCWWLPLRIGR